MKDEDGIYMERYAHWSECIVHYKDGIIIYVEPTGYKICGAQPNRWWEKLFGLNKHICIQSKNHFSDHISENLYSEVDYKWKNDMGNYDNSWLKIEEMEYPSFPEPPKIEDFNKRFAGINNLKNFKKFKSYKK